MHQGFSPGQAGIFDGAGFALACEGDERIKTNKGVAAPFFTALHGFEQKNMLAVFAYLGKKSERGVQIGNQGAVHRYQVVTGQGATKGGLAGLGRGCGSIHAANIVRRDEDRTRPITAVPRLAALYRFQIIFWCDLFPKEEKIETEGSCEPLSGRF